MRHTTVTHMLEAGIPLVVVKNFLGHVSLQTTQIYRGDAGYYEPTASGMEQKWFVKDDLGGAANKSIENTQSFLK